jgi:UDP:flavonoid glycosyltransferase YjiC (YdhE family)
MRILFTFAGLRGHLEPLVPIARAARAAGHTVAFAPDPWIAHAVLERGFDVVGPAPAPEPGPPGRRPLSAYDRENEERVLREVYVGRFGRDRARRLIGLCADWEPDVVVRDEADFGAAVAAERLGLPRATVLVLASAFVRPQAIGAALDELRAEHGLAPDPELAALERDLVLSPFPPSLRDPGTAVPIRLTPPGAAGGEAVYFTLGTVFNLESGDLFTRVLAGLRELDAEVIVTVGHGIDPGELGPQPPHVRVEQYVDQREVLPRCAAVVTHAGSGSVLGALAHGLPSVLLPIGADQPLNAERCAQLGAARVLDPLTVTPNEVRAAVSEVLERPGYRGAAERLRDELARLPGPEHAVELLSALASRRP